MKTFESNQGHIVIVRDNGRVSLVGRAGMPLDYSYISLDKELLKTVGSDPANAVAHLNGGSFFNWKEV
jgi:hypothetical protein